MVASFAAPLFAENGAAVLLPERETVVHVELASSCPSEKQAGCTVTFRTAKGLYSIHSKWGVDILSNSRQQQLETGLPMGITGLQKHPSGHFFIGRYKTGEQARALLFFLGQPFASSPGHLLIVGFSSDGKPYVVFDKEEYELYAFRTDKSKAKLIGKATMSEAVLGDAEDEPQIATYDPYSVFLINANGRAELSQEESETYNRLHYVWAGPKSREDYYVLFRAGRRPFGLRANQIDHYMKTKVKR
ncbi:MAG: hypothetical protein JSS87_00610 [Acidobacteria bacterium]|nr:hypothetical protein [Acidobacteriota bacterium]